MMDEIPTQIEGAQKEAMSRDGRSLEATRHDIIQGIINGYLMDDQPALLRAAGLSRNDVNMIRTQAERACRKIDTSSVDWQRVKDNMRKFLLENVMPAITDLPTLTVFSLGCGEAPEAAALLEAAADRIAQFTGFDRHEPSLDFARSRNPKDKRIGFQLFDLQDGLPLGNPNFVIIRNPNIYIPEGEGQETINTTWEWVLARIRKSYPQAAILVTTITSKEIRLVQKLAGNGNSPILQNPFTTPVDIDLPAYGTFQLPAAPDQYYVLYSRLPTPQGDQPTRLT